MAQTDVAIIGIGMHRFGRTVGVSGRAQGAHAVRLALADAELQWSDIQFAYGGSASSGNADTLVNELGMTSIPFTNVSNGCATGGSALSSAVATIKSGAHEIGLVVGFDKHPRGAFNADPEENGLGKWYGQTGLMLTTQFFAMKLQRYLYEYPMSASVLSKIAVKAYRNGSLNENAWRREELSEEQISNSTMVNDPLTQYMFCSPGEGAVALIVCDASMARRFHRRPIFLRSICFRTRRFGSFEVFSPWLSPDRADGPTTEAARGAFEQASIDPSDVDVAQIQDTEVGAELMHMAETGLCEHGAQENLILSGATNLDGSLPINTDGGCIANGEPIGASGLRQVYENVLQLRGDAGRHQVVGRPRVAFSHVYGAPGVSACTITTS